MNGADIRAALTAMLSGEMDTDTIAKRSFRLKRKASARNNSRRALR